MNLNEMIRRCVAFIGIRKDGVFSPRATAFCVDWLEGQHRFRHLVTAEHVISTLITAGHDIWLRANVKNGGFIEAPIPHDAFVYHPEDEIEATDVAVTAIAPSFETEDGKPVEIDLSALTLNGDRGFIPTEYTTQNVIKLGADIAVVGLFRSHFGKNKNVPIVRVGNIACLPDEPVWTEYKGYIQAYLIECRSIAGLSGSPVFILPDPSVLLAQVMGGRSYEQVGRDSCALLGLMHGHFDVPKLNEDVVADSDNPERSVHTGIGVVVPIQKIVETINHPDLIAMRKQVIDNLKKAGATADVVPEDVSLPASDANPTHQEDFRRLLGAAARKPAQED